MVPQGTKDYRFWFLYGICIAEVPRGDLEPRSSWDVGTTLLWVRGHDVAMLPVAEVGVCAAMGEGVNEAHSHEKLRN